MKRTIKIYTLEDSITNEIKYVGKTCRSLKQRLREHISPTKARDDARWRWICSLTQPPIIKLLDEYDEDIYDKKYELYYMWLIKSWGFDLVNTIWGAGDHNPSTKIVYQYDLEGNYLRTFSSIISTGHISLSRALKKNHCAYGFRWSYKKVIKLPPYAIHFTIVYAYNYKGDYCGWVDTKDATKTERKGIMSNIRGNNDKRNKNRIAYKGFRWFRTYQGISIKSKYPSGNSKKN